MIKSVKRVKMEIEPFLPIFPLRQTRKKVTSKSKHETINLWRQRRAAAAATVALAEIVLPLPHCLKYNDISSLVCDLNNDTRPSFNISVPLRIVIHRAIF
jgi:hypothetical protein